MEFYIFQKTIIQSGQSVLLEGVEYGSRSVLRTKLFKIQNTTRDTC